MRIRWQIRDDVHQAFMRSAARWPGLVGGGTVTLVQLNPRTQHEVAVFCPDLDKVPAYAALGAHPPAAAPGLRASRVRGSFAAALERARRALSTWGPDVRRAPLQGQLSPHSARGRCQPR
ncbi:hypothetical protein GCM10022248_48810 [Nonomuraea soli]